MLDIILVWLWGFIAGATRARSEPVPEDVLATRAERRRLRVRIAALVGAGGLVAAAPLQLVIPLESVRIGVGVAGMLVILLALAWIYGETVRQLDTGEEDDAQRAVARLVSGGGITPRGTRPVGRDPAQASAPRRTSAASTGRGHAGHDSR